MQVSHNFVTVFVTKEIYDDSIVTVYKRLQIRNNNHIVTEYFLL